MKTCNKCGEDKLEVCFSFRYKDRGIRQHTCKDCYKDIMKCHYRNTKQSYFSRNKISYEKKLAYIRKLKEDTACKDCGIFYPHYVMEFDHISNKLHAISSLISRSWKALHSEMLKCDIVCSNCHAERTWNRKKIPS